MNKSNLNLHWINLIWIWGLLQCRISIRNSSKDSNLTKSHLSIAPISVAQSFWNFTQSTAVLCEKISKRLGNWEKSEEQMRFCEIRVYDEFGMDIPYDYALEVELEVRVRGPTWSVRGDRASDCRLLVCSHCEGSCKRQTNQSAPRAHIHDKQNGEMVRSGL